MKRTPIKRTRTKPRTTKTVRCKRQRCSRAVVVAGLCKTHTIERLDSIVRHRAYEEIGSCQRCGRTSQLQWSHNLRRKHMWIRWDPRNYTVHCAPCHYLFTHNGDLHTEWIQQHVGIETYDWLMDMAWGARDEDGNRAGVPHFNTSDLIEAWERLS